MPDLAKLASLSKKFKGTDEKTHSDTSRLHKQVGAAPATSPAATPAIDDAPAAAAPRASSSPMASASPGGPMNVQVKVDLSPLQDILGRVRDEIRNLKDEMVKTREKGMKFDFGDGAAEIFDNLLKHFSAMSKASREQAEKLVASLPESRWYVDLQALLREMGEGMATGGGGSGGGNGALATDLVTIKEALAMQQTQLTAIMSIMQRRG